MNLSKQGPMNDDGRSGYQPGRLWLRLRSNGARRGRQPLPPEERVRRRALSQQKHVAKRKAKRAAARRERETQRQPGWCLVCRTARATPTSALCGTCRRALAQADTLPPRQPHQLTHRYQRGQSKAHEANVRRLEQLRLELPL